ncbi:hypothetical protein AO069_27225 [Pseudomonas syringae pv. syringae PD2774]|uniref:hypothetical protein n=1 Tax=Pseudomonas syringae TaxID=317 RepID=UPI0007373A8A|nr:hypothetical protein [Pseudomonas syringae]KTB79623.1 hypothetical protein AO069_27225 [Pseudomonas syringae pv. syringae PD2774]
MQYQQLGDAGLLVSELVLGTVPCGGRAEFASWRQSKQIENLIRHQDAQRYAAMVVGDFDTFAKFCAF